MRSFFLKSLLICRLQYHSSLTVFCFLEEVDDRVWRVHFPNNHHYDLANIIVASLGFFGLLFGLLLGHRRILAALANTIS